MASYTLAGTRTALTKVKRRDQQFDDDDDDDEMDEGDDDDSADSLRPGRDRRGSIQNDSDDEDLMEGADDEISVSDDQEDEGLLAAQKASRESHAACEAVSVAWLCNATGRPEDVCLAALLETNGDRDEAAFRVLTRASSTAGVAADASSSSSARASQPLLNIPAEAEELAKITGRSLQECAVALRVCDGIADNAVNILLGDEVPELKNSTEARSEFTGASALSEATGHTIPECIDALKSCNGRLEAAASMLLSSTPSTVPEVKIQEELPASHVRAGKEGELPITSASGSMEVTVFSPTKKIALHGVPSGQKRTSSCATASTVTSENRAESPEILFESSDSDSSA